MILLEDHKPITHSWCVTCDSWTESLEKIKILHLPAYCYLLPQKVYLDVLFPRLCVVLPDNLSFYDHVCTDTTEVNCVVMNHNGQK